MGFIGQDGKIYVGQTALSLRLKTEVDLTYVTIALIKYKKPDGTLGSFTATLYDIVKGIIEYIVKSASDLDQRGEWTFWSHLTFANGNVAPGEAFIEMIYNEGE
jgi:hypothetical protein